MRAGRRQKGATSEVEEDVWLGFGRGDRLGVAIARRKYSIVMVLYTDPAVSGDAVQCIM